MERLLRNLFAGAVILVGTSTLAWAQATAELAGRVTDESGAVLPGVSVTVTQTDTGFTRTTVTDGEGGYSLPNLPTGPYRLEVVVYNSQPPYPSEGVTGTEGSDAVAAVIGRIMIIP